MRELILSKINNVGALCNFLNNVKNIKYLEYLNDNIPIDAINLKLSEKLWYFINEETELQTCICGNMRSYIGPKNGYRSTCGYKVCSNKIRRETNIKKYGVDNPKKIDYFIEKGKETIGKKYGVEWAQQNRDIKNKSIETWKINPNKEEIINKRKNILLNKTKEEKEIINQNKHFFPNIDIALKIETYKNQTGILEFIKLNYNGEILTNTKSIIYPNELDIYLPELNLAFEFNGLYWHSEIYKEKKFHLNKTNNCLSKGIKLFHIWEDDWLNNKSIIQSMILNKLGKSLKIYGRKCIVKEVNDNNLIRNFLKTNHIQGFVGSKIKLGLFFNDELVSLMTFGSYRKNMNSSHKEGCYELLRFCNKLNTTVVGGASKLFKYFIKNYNPIEIISYSDYSRSNGDMYKNLGFEFSHLSNPNYYYIIDNKRSYRFNFRKDILVKQGFDPSMSETNIMHSRGYYRLFDCGMEKWIYKLSI